MIPLLKLVLKPVGRFSGLKRMNGANNRFGLRHWEKGSTCIATGKSSAKSGGKKRSACFFAKPGIPVWPSSKN